MVITVVVFFLTRSPDSAFGTVTGVRAELVRGERLFELKRTDRLYVSFSPILNRFCRLFPRVLKQPIPEHDHLYPSVAEIKNWRSRISILPIRLQHAKSQYFTLFHLSSTTCIQKRNGKGKGKGKKISVQAYYRRIGYQEVEAHRFLNNRHRLPLLPLLPYPGNTYTSVRG